MTSLALACKLNAARTPTSLALRALAAVKRAGGTVLGAGAAVPVLGPELCTDGGFNVGVADWTAAGGVHTWTGSALRRAIGQGNAGSYRDFTVTPNAEYLVGGAILNAVGSGGLVLNIYGGGGFTGLLASIPATGYAFVRPTTSTLRIYFYTDNNRGADLDDVTVRLFSGYTYGNPPVRNFFDSAGTDILDSVTQVDQPVGLVLDAAGTVGPNISPALSDAAWQKTNAAWATVAGKAVATACPDGQSYYATGLIGQNKSYQYTLTIDSISSGSVYVLAGGAGGSVTHSTAGTFTGYIKTGAGNTNLNIITGGVTTAAISAFIVTELTGSHATQPTTGSKPTLRRGLVNQLLWSGDFTNAAWNKTGTTVATGQPDPSGGSSGFKLVESATSSQHYFLQNAISGSGMASVAYIVKAAGRTKVRIRSEGPQTLGLATNFNLSTATIQSGSGSIADMGNGFYLCVANSTGNGSGASGYHLIQPTDDAWNESYLGDGTSGVIVYRAAIYQGTVTAQQIIAAGGIPLTTTAPASSALGNYWWQFDPTAPGDFLQTSITTGATGWMCAGITFSAVPPAALQVLGTTATGGLDGAGLLVTTGGTSLLMSVGNGTTQHFASRSAPAVGVPAVVEGGWDSSTVTVALNGIETSAARSGVATSPGTLTIGARQVSPSAYLNGALPVTVICPTLPPPADRALIRKWVGSLQGQTL